MRLKHAWIALLCLPLAAQQHEIGLTLGGLASQDRSGLSLSSGLALQANYGYRLLEAKAFAVYGEVHMLANAQRLIRSPNPSATRDVATLFVTPGVRLKFNPKGRVSPYGVVGGGYALYEQSTTVLSGALNPAPRFIHRGAFDYGAGADFRGWRWIGLRAEVRDFYTGSPVYNLSGLRGGQHNVVIGGGLVLRFR